jgi:acetolactate synthase-1/2/3 large subunit
MIKVSDAIAQFLKEKNIDVAFGIIGSANSHIFDSINNLGFTKIICLHHEQAAVMAMAAYYRTTGKLAVSLVTAGAGASNSITGVLSNWADSIPGLIISGQEPSRYLKNNPKRMFGTQGFSSSEMVSKITKYSKLIIETNKLADELELAFHLSTNGRPGPVWIEFPFDVQSKLIEPLEFKNAIKVNLGESIANDFVDEILNELQKAKKPVILVGNGVNLSNAQSEIYELLDSLNLPFMSTWSAIDIIDNSHDKYFGRFGLYGQRHANFIIQKCDFLLSLGSRLAIPQVGYNFDEFAPNAKIIAVDLDIEELKKHSRIKGVEYDVRLILKALNLSIKNKNKNWDFFDWLNECKNIRNQFPLLMNEYFLDDKFVNSYLFLNKFSKDVKSGEVVVTDMGTALLSGHQVMEVRDYKMFTSQGLGEMGVGLPYAIGAKLGVSDPSKNIHCLNCDGGIMMNLQELQTIKHLGGKIKIIIFNNQGYLMIKHTQKMLFQSRYSAVDDQTGVSFPNFEALAAAFEFKYLKLSNMNEYEHVMNDYFEFDGVLFLEVMMDPEQDFIPKVKGVPVAESNDIFSPPLEEMSPLLSLKTIQQVMGPNISHKSNIIDRN